MSSITPTSCDIFHRRRWTLAVSGGLVRGGPRVQEERLRVSSKPLGGGVQLVASLSTPIRCMEGPGSSAPPRSRSILPPPSFLLSQRRAVIPLG